MILTLKLDIFAISRKSLSFVNNSSFLFMQIEAINMSEAGFGFPIFLKRRCNLIAKT